MEEEEEEEEVEEEKVKMEALNELKSKICIEQIKPIQAKE